MVDTLHPPPSVIASWPKPNYVDPQTQGPALFYICIVLSAIGIFIVSARLYSRIFITKALGFDDGLIVLALAFGVALSTLVIIGNKVWLSGHHIWDIPPSKYAGHRLNIWVSEWCYVASLSATKISVLLFYRRLSVSFSRTFMIATWIGILYNVLFVLSFCMALLLLYRPLNAYWDAFDPQWVATHTYSSGSEQVALPLSGVFSVIGDFYSALLPMLVIVNLDLPRRQKISLYALFSLAFLVVGAGIARTVLLNIVMNKDYDFTWVLWDTWIWAVVEMYLALLAASAPALKPFFRRFLVEPIGSAVDSSRKKRSNRYGDDTGASKSKGWSIKSSSVRESAIISDPERIGVAFGGGSDTAKSCEESFVREVDDDDLDTRHFELRYSRDGKIVPMQVWKKTSIPISTDPRPARPRTRDNPPTQGRGHVRNFSQPHSYTSSDTTAGATRQVQRRLSQGSVKAGRLAAQRRVSHATEDVEKALPTSIKRPFANSEEGRGSRLDPPSDSESDDEYYGSEKPPWNDIRSPSRSRSTSEETLHLPRMGSFDPETRARTDMSQPKILWGRDIGHGRY